MSGIDISARSARSQIASAIHVVLQLERLSDGRRCVTSIAEVTGMEGDTVLMQEIFALDRRGIDAQGRVLGELLPTGIRPRFMDYLVPRGINLPADMFNPYSRAES
jgi:pilus assembly protein CpaF